MWLSDYINEWNVLNKLVAIANFTQVVWKQEREKMNFKLLAVFIAFIVAASIISSAEAEFQPGPQRISTFYLD